MSQDEAAAISGEDDPEAAARWALDRPGTATQWCLIKLGAAGALLVTRNGDSPLRHNSLKVRGQDSVPSLDTEWLKLPANLYWQTMPDSRSRSANSGA